MVRFSHGKMRPNLVGLPTNLASMGSAITVRLQVGFFPFYFLLEMIDLGCFYNRMLRSHFRAEIVFCPLVTQSPLYVLLLTYFLMVLTEMSKI